jgi:hypothetical protein
MLLSSYFLHTYFGFLNTSNGFAKEEELQEAHVIIFFIH